MIEQSVMELFPGWRWRENEAMGEPSMKRQTCQTLVLAAEGIHFTSTRKKLPQVVSRWEVNTKNQKI